VSENEPLRHFARCCWSTNRNIKPDDSINHVKAGNTTQRQQQDTTSANKIEQSNKHPVDSSSDDEYTFSFGNIKTHAIKSKVKSPKVHVKIMNMPTEIMIDTGAKC
jgi:hypothetical protein